MIVDTSAILAILFGESESEQFKKSIVSENKVQLSLASYLEASLRIDYEKEPILSRALDDLIEILEIELVPISVNQAKIAREANRDFGKGSGHPAKLNFADCFTYALAKESGEPLLFKGNDFSKTDVKFVL